MEKQTQNSYTREELLDCGHGKLFGEGNAQLPVPNMLMMDRINLITDEGGLHGKGQIKAELDSWSQSRCTWTDRQAAMRLS
jgi:3-hydroxyacyl-[acyl-carrier protein] dehydratase/trans-2-decenoyl-[acyl-carrier protein] isomerase